MESKIATDLSATRFPWWVVLVEGSLALIFGLLLITAPRATSVFLVTVLGLYLLIRGILSIIEIFLPKRSAPHTSLHVVGESELANLREPIGYNPLDGLLGPPTKFTTLSELSFTTRTSVRLM